MSKFYNEKSQNQKISNKNFAIKFTESQLQQPQAPNSQVVLVNRSQRADEFMRMSNRIESKGKQYEAESNSELNISRGDLPSNKKAKEQIDYEKTNSSAIVKSFDVLSCFFKHQVKFKLLFRASDHNFSVADFHQRCDSYSNTLTLCLTEDFKVIGGFTSLSWQENFEQNKTYFKSDFTRETFLFSVTNNVKYPLAKALKNKAICCFRSYGPTFGGGYDLLIGDRTNQVASSCSYFPRNFEIPKGCSFDKHQFTGTSRKHFKLQEWEVYCVSRVQDVSTMQNCNFVSQPKVSEEIRREESWLQKFKVCARQVYNKLCQDL